MLGLFVNFILELGHGKRVLACVKDGSHLLVNSICETAPKSLFWASKCVLGLEYAP